MLLKKISTYQFAILDLQMFLDTHPNDLKSLGLIKEYREKLAPLVEEYEDKFGPLVKSSAAANQWNWLKNPWPWNNEEDM